MRACRGRTGVFRTQAVADWPIAPKIQSASPGDAGDALELRTTYFDSAANACVVISSTLP